MNIKLDNVRIAFVNIFEAKQVQGQGEPRFSATFIIPPTHPAVAKLDAGVAAVAKEKWKGTASTILAKLRADGRICFHKSAKTNGEGEVYDGFAGMFDINASSKVRPGVYDRDRSPLTSVDGKPYPGCYVCATIELWAQDNQYGKRINASLRGVQFYRDGDAFAGGGRPAEPNDFDDLSVEDTADDLI